MNLKDPQDALGLLVRLAQDPCNAERNRRIAEARTTLLSLIEGAPAGAAPDDGLDSLARRVSRLEDALIEAGLLAEFRA